MTMPGEGASGGLIAPLERFTKAVNKLFAFLAAITVFVIMIFVLTAVIARYGFNKPLNELLDLTIDDELSVVINGEFFDAADFQRVIGKPE